MAVRFLCADALQQVAYSITIQIIDLVCCLKGRPYNFKFIAVRRYHKLTANGFSKLSPHAMIDYRSELYSPQSRVHCLGQELELRHQRRGLALDVVL